MTTLILTSTDCGPYYGEERHSYQAETLSQAIGQIRSAFDYNVGAVLVKSDDTITGMWLYEPDVDCDDDGYYAVAGDYIGQEYRLYRPHHLGFWNYVSYHFSHQYVPDDIGFVSARKSAYLARA
jgi:hypothetical protein